MPNCKFACDCEPDTLRPQGVVLSIVFPGRPWPASSLLICPAVKFAEDGMVGWNRYISASAGLWLRGNNAER